MTNKSETPPIESDASRQSDSEDQQLSRSTFDAKAFLKHVSVLAGVYKMYDEQEKILYVGKARHLKNRLSSYFLKNVSTKTAALVAKIARIDVIVTPSETEALILEHTLIKEFLPPYNVLLRDDKSYPYLYIATDQQYPLIKLHRGIKNKGGDYFGPYPNAYAVRASLNNLTKMFKLRTCDDSYFANRSRPCLQYQIKRCSGPCVGLISSEEYADTVEHAKQFLDGKRPELLQTLTARMETFSQNLEFEKAAELRDQILQLRKVQEAQSIVKGKANVDIIAVQIAQGLAVVHILCVRNGQMLGSKSYFPKLAIDDEPEQVLETFMGQYYINLEAPLGWPDECVLSENIDNQTVLADTFKSLSGKQIRIAHQVKQERKKWLEMAVTNAQEQLKTAVNNKTTAFARMKAVGDLLHLDEVPKRLECYDISHTQGELTVGSCVVFDQAGPLNREYRRFNIEGITPGDDYAAMEQVIYRRFTRLIKEDAVMPDLVLIDGGKGQINKAYDVLKSLQLAYIPVIGVAKGPSRKPGLEDLINPATMEYIKVENDSAALHLIQYIRDESHRFAIEGHRKKRDKKRRVSTLEQIEGVGPKRRKSLLQYFGGLRELKGASQVEIAKVPGINAQLAKTIFDQLHQD